MFDWPRLQVWMNDEPVQDLDVESKPELRWRLRRGYPGLQSLSYPIRFRNLRIRAPYPKIEPETWYLMQLVAKGGDCLVRINGETVMEYHSLEDTAPGHIMLQAHQAGRWIEYKQIRIKRL